MAIKTAKELAAAAEAVAKNYKTLYVMGCFGAPMTGKNKARYTKNHSYNRQTDRKAMINAASADTFGFDCVCLIKGLLWGWNGDTAKVYGGAGYAINGVPDIDANAMFRKCKDASTDFSKIQVGEAVWMKGHIGIYIGNGLAVECTPKWDNCVQITACNCDKPGYNRRNWTKHGKLPYVTYLPEVTYRVHVGGRWLPWVTGYNEIDGNGYAGLLGKEITDIQVMADGKSVTVKQHTCSASTGDAIDCIAMKAEGCQLRYRAHTKDGKWLPWVTGCDVSDDANGYAGVLGKAIDAVQIDVVE